MIAVVNISEEKGVPYSREGLQHYRVQLNRIPLAEFEHLAENGMSACLVKAATAVENVDIDEKIKEFGASRIKTILEEAQKGV